MSEAVPTYAQEAYAILRGRFSSDSFPADYMSWFVSRSMVKKTLHTLEHAGWIRRVHKGSYVCKNADDITSLMHSPDPSCMLQRVQRFFHHAPRNEPRHVIRGKAITAKTASQDGVSFLSV